MSHPPRLAGATPRRPRPFASSSPTIAGTGGKLEMGLPRVIHAVSNEALNRVFQSGDIVPGTGARLWALYEYRIIEVV